MIDQISKFESGGFVVHRVHIGGSACRFSAWYDAAGKLCAAERIDKRNRSANPTCQQMAALQSCAKRYQDGSVYFRGRLVIEAAKVEA